MHSSLAAFRRVLRNRRLRRLLAAFFLSGAAEWGSWVAVLVWAHEARGATFVGIVAAVQLVISAVIAPYVSSLGDRMTRSTALAFTFLGMGVTSAATGLAFSSGTGVVIPLILASLAASTFSVVRPVHASLIPDLSDEPADAVAANVVSSTLEAAGTFVGPALAGLILTLGDPSVVFFVFGIAAGVAGLLVARVGEVARAGGVVADVEDGLRAAFVMLRRLPTQRYVLLLSGTSQLVAGSLDVLTVVLAIETLGLGESGAGFVVSLLGLGGLAGGVLAFSVVGRRLGPVLVVGAAVRGGALIVLGVQPGWWLVLLFVSGAGLSLIDIGVRTMLQRLIAPDAMSRVFGVLEGVSLIGLAGGSLLASGVIAAFGTSTAFVVFGALIPFTVVVGYQLLSRADREADVPGDVIEAFQRVGILSLLGPPALEGLARRSRIVRFDPGSVIITEGETSRFVLVVLDGSVEVTKDGRRLAELGEGDIVGEIAALHDVPRTASVTALTPVTSISVPGDAFTQAVRGETEAWSMSASVAGQRLAQQQS